MGGCDFLNYETTRGIGGVMGLKVQSKIVTKDVFVIRATPGRQNQCSSIYKGHLFLRYINTDNQSTCFSNPKRRKTKDARDLGSWPWRYIAVSEMPRNLHFSSPSSTGISKDRFNFGLQSKRLSVTPNCDQFYVGALRQMQCILGNLSSSAGSIGAQFQRSYLLNGSSSQLFSIFSLFFGGFGQDSGVSGTVSHFLQLTTHHPELKHENNSLNDTSKKNSGSEPDHPFFGLTDFIRKCFSLSLLICAYFVAAFGNFCLIVRSGRFFGFGLPIHKVLVGLSALSLSGLMIFCGLYLLFF
jgi:hypothetical protein